MSEKKPTSRTLSRRALLTRGSAGFAGASLGFAGALGASPAGRGERMTMPPGEGAPLEQVFLLEPGMLSLLDAPGERIVGAGPWGFGAEASRWLQHLRAAVEVTPDEVEQWTMGVLPRGNTPLAALQRATVQGGPNLSPLVGQSLRSVLDLGELDLALDFRYPARMELQKGLALPILGRTGVEFPGLEQPGIELPGQVVPGKGAPAAVTLYGWRLQFRTDIPHPFGGCEPSPVSHFHVELFHEISPGRYAYVVNFHLGAYRNSAGQLCLVLWENVRWGVCWKICSPTYNQLVEMFKLMLTIAAIIAAVALAAWIIAAIAAAAAAVAWVPLLALA